MKTIVISLLISTFGGTAVAAQSEPLSADYERVSTIVVYRDLDLSTENGRLALDDRLREAARKTCGPRRNNLPDEAARQGCVRDAYQGAWDTVTADVPHLDLSVAVRSYARRATF